VANAYTVWGLIQRGQSSLKRSPIGARPPTGQSKPDNTILFLYPAPGEVLSSLLAACALTG